MQLLNTTAMYRGFKIKNSSIKRLLENDHKQSYYDIGKRVVQKLGNVFKDHINYKSVDILDYKSEDILDGTAIQDEWFPQTQCDIFISHSHKDEELAITLAGWLWDTFKLIAFVDSSIWGYADELVEILEEMDESVSDNNYITSHVHNMLTVALMEMIDKTECLFFLNTPNSIYLNEIYEYTLSPWIFSEIGISKMIEKRLPQRWLSTRRRIIDSEIGHKVDTSHLMEIDTSILKKWEKSGCLRVVALDKLYDILDNL